MADETPITVTENERDTAQEMEVEASNASDQTTADAAADGCGNREIEEEMEPSDKEENGGEAKKPKVDEDMSVEEKRPEDESETVDGGENNSTAAGAEVKGPVSLGYKNFETSEQMFEYFFKLLHFWTPNVNVNKYEHEMLLDLLKKGHMEPEKKIGAGIHAFQVRYHPQWRSRCFFLVREDDSSDDFSFRKCVDHILPLPESMKIKSDANKALGGGHGGKSGGRGGGRGNWRGGGRGRGGGGGGKPRN